MIHPPLVSSISAVFPAYNDGGTIASMVTAALLALRQRHGETDEAIRLTGAYHNLLRMWAST